MSELSRADDPAASGPEPKPKQRRPWDTPVLREIVIDDITTGGKGSAPSETIVFGTHFGPS